MFILIVLIPFRSGLVGSFMNFKLLVKAHIVLVLFCKAFISQCSGFKYYERLLYFHCWVVSCHFSVLVLSILNAVVKLCVCAGGSGAQQGSARRRAGKGDRAGQDGAAAASGDKSDLKDETDHVSVSSLAEVQSDLNPQDPLQKVVRFSVDLSLLLTGGTDGNIRVWEVNAVKLTKHNGLIITIIMP